MSKATKNERISTLERQVTALITLVKMKGYNESEPQLKQLDQSIFDGLDEKWRFAAFNTPSNSPILFSVKPHESMYGKWYAVLDCDEYMTLDELEGVYEYTDDWQNSLIERDTAKDLTGSELCKAMIIGDRDWVLAYVSNENDATALFHKNAMVVTDFDLSEDAFYCRGENFAYAVPINNQGEPLTASEVGL